MINYENKNKTSTEKENDFKKKFILNIKLKFSLTREKINLNENTLHYNEIESC